MNQKPPAGSRAHLHTLNVEAAGARAAASREAATLKARAGSVHARGIDQLEIRRAEQRAEALRRAAYWIDTALAFTPMRGAGR